MQHLKKQYLEIGVVIGVIILDLVSNSQVPKVINQ
jgi:hypothetical protein